MKVTKAELEGVLIIEPRVFEDPRGYFVETYNQPRYAAAGLERTFVQDNMSQSAQGTLRGLHYQVERPQAKLVWAVEGEVVDVVVNLRPGSSTFGRWAKFTLRGDSKTQIFVPEGFAHGFCVVSPHAVVQYKCTDVYDRASEAGVRYDDPQLAIEWPIDSPILSEKDAQQPFLANARLPTA